MVLTSLGDANLRCKYPRSRREQTDRLGVRERQGEERPPMVEQGSAAPGAHFSVKQINQPGGEPCLRGLPYPAASRPSDRERASPAERPASSSAWWPSVSSSCSAGWRTCSRSSTSRTDDSWGVGIAHGGGERRAGL